MYCGKCGIKNLERAKFCRDCGANMSYERERGILGNIFFVSLLCIMLIFVTFSLIYYSIRENVGKQKLDSEIYYVYNKM